MPPLALAPMADDIADDAGTLRLAEALVNGYGQVIRQQGALIGQLQDAVAELQNRLTVLEDRAHMGHNDPARIRVLETAVAKVADELQDHAGDEARHTPAF